MVIYARWYYSHRLAKVFQRLYTSLTNISSVLYGTFSDFNGTVTGLDAIAITVKSQTNFQTHRWKILQRLLFLNFQTWPFDVGYELRHLSFRIRYAFVSAFHGTSLFSVIRNIGLNNVLSSLPSLTLFVQFSNKYGDYGDKIFQPAVYT